MHLFSVLPIVQHGQQIFSTIEGIPVTLPCKASGVPQPSITWSKVMSCLWAVHGGRWIDESKLSFSCPITRQEVQSNTSVMRNLDISVYLSAFVSVLSGYGLAIHQGSLLWKGFFGYPSDVIYLYFSILQKFLVFLLWVGNFRLDNLPQTES